jgi:hypothetical protein
MKLHDLTEKEIQKLDEAASTVKKFAKYIKDVNLDNYWLKKNLDESIKAGDVTNEQKVHLGCYDSAVKIADGAFGKIRERCKEIRPGCSCSQEDHRECPIYDEFIVASWLADAAKGSDMCWKWIFEYACIGRKIKVGYPLDKALNKEVKL